MARKTLDPNNLTIDFKQLMRLSIQDRVNFFRQGGASYFESLTPTQLAQLFPRYYQQALPDIGRAVSGGTRGAGGGGGGGGMPSGAGKITGAEAAPSVSGIPPTTTAPAPKKSKVADENTILESLEKMTGGRSGQGSPESLGFAKAINGNNQFSSTLANQRLNRGGGSLSDSQKKHFYALAIAEMGSPESLRKKGIDPVEAYAAFMETPYNRGMTENAKKHIEQNLQSNYYEPLRTHTSGYRNYTGASSRLSSDKELYALLDDAHNRVVQGSNYSNLATQNSSAGVAANARRQQTVTTEKYGELLSRKDVSAYASIHGPGTIKNTQKWVADTQRQIELEQQQKSLASTKPVGLTPEQKSEIRRKRSMVASTLEDPEKSYTPQSVKQMMQDGKKYFEMDVNKPGADKVTKMIEDAGGTVVPYNRGQGNKEWGEKYRKADEVVNESIRTRKKLQHLDNTEAANMNYENFKYILEKGKENGITFIPKNPHIDPAGNNNWIKYLKDNPEYAKNIPYVNIENIGSMDEGQIRTLEELKKLLPPSVELKGVDWTANKPNSDKIKMFTEKFGTVEVARGSERGKGYVFDQTSIQYPYVGGGTGEAISKQAVIPPGALPQNILDNPSYQEYVNRFPSQKDKFDNAVRQAIDRGAKPEDIFNQVQQGLKQISKAAPPSAASPEQIVEPQKTSSAPGGIVSPVTGFYANNGASNVYGASRSGGRRPHSGIDWQAKNGSSVHAMTGGTILYSGNNRGYGANIVVKGDDGVIRRYAAHGSVINKKIGSRVEQGEEIGKIGSDHLHYEEVHPNLSNGKSNPVYNEFIKNSGEFVRTSYQRGTTDPSTTLGLKPGTKVEGGKVIVAPKQEEAPKAEPVSSAPVSLTDSNMRLVPPPSPPPAVPAQPPAPAAQTTPAAPAQPATPTAQPAATAQPAPAPVPPAATATATPQPATQPPAATAAPAPATAQPEPPPNEYGGEYQATSEDMAVVNTRTGKPEFTFNRDEQLSLQDGRLKVTPENRTNPDQLKPVNQFAENQQQPQSSYENAAGMFSGIQPQSYSTSTPPSSSNFSDRLHPASMPQNDGITRAMAQSIGFHDPVGSNYGYGTAAGIRNGFDTTVNV